MRQPRVLMRVLRPLFAALLFFSLVAPAQASPADEVYAITHVHVIPMDGERVLENQTVIVRDGRIEALGPAAAVAIPPGAVTIAARGQYLMPGLVDMHTHLLSDDRIANTYADEELAVILANGVTTARLNIGKPSHLRYRQAIADGALTGPRLYVASPQFSGRAFGRIFNGYAVTSPKEAEMAVQQAHASGYDFIKITFRIPPPVYDAIVATAAQVGLPVIGHVGPQVGLARAMKAGQQIEHLDEYMEALLPTDAPVPGGISGVGVWQRANWASLDYIDTARIPLLARQSVAAGIWNTPTLAFLNSAFGTGRSTTAIDNSPDARFVSPSVKAELLRGRQAFWSKPPDIAHRQKYVQFRNDLTRALYQAGAKLLAGSDAPEWMMLYGFTLHRELEHLVQAGLPPYAALETATRNPAEWLGALDTFGTVEVGKQADLLLLEANPLEDIRHTQRIAGVMAQGRWMNKAKLKKMLDASAAVLSEAPLLTDL